MKIHRVCGTIILILAHAATSEGQTKFKVDGYVKDSKGSPIPGVMVGIYSTSNKDSVEPARTNKSGYYKIEKPITDTYDILYTHTNFDLSTVEMLAENSTQHINIKMYRRGEKRPAVAFHGNLQSAERLLVLAVSRNEEGKNRLLKVYRESRASALLTDSDMPAINEDSKNIRELLERKRRYIKALELTVNSK